MNLAQAAHILACCVPVDVQEKLYCGAAVDSRILKNGQLFFALPGAKVDGHHFLEEAAQKGAAAAVVQKSYNGLTFGLPLLRVEDPLAALQSLARNVLSHRNLKIVAVTGSLGKTTTKDFIAALLSSKYVVAASPGNSNSQIGLPLTILNHLPDNTEVAVFEMGMTHPHQISQLIEIAPPDVAVITKTALVHACNFNSIEEIALAKSEILEHPKTSLGIVSRDAAAFDQVIAKGKCSKVSFSTTLPQADYMLYDEYASLKVSAPNETAVLPPLRLPGKHNVHNLLAAIVVARHFELTWEEIIQGMALLILPDKRLQIVEKQGILFVNDSYNASAPSIKAALLSLPAPKSGGKKIAVIGEMMELGKFSEACHREVGEEALLHVDQMICYGKGCQPISDCWQAANKPVVWAPDFETLSATLWKQAQPGDVVLLKGSRSNGLWNLLTIE